VLYLFNTRQYARLLVFRSRLQDHLAGKDQAGDSSSLASAGCSGMRMAWREW
jgi:hypothetical protein